MRFLTYSVDMWRLPWMRTSLTITLPRVGKGAVAEVDGAGPPVPGVGLGGGSVEGDGDGAAGALPGVPAEGKGGGSMEGTGRSGTWARPTTANTSAARA